MRATRDHPAGTLPADTPPPMSDSDFAALGRLIRERTGIILNEGKRWMLTLRLTRELRRLGLRDFASYRKLLAHPTAEDERHALTSAVTTNVTSFFRGPGHFTMLAAMIPELRHKVEAGGRLRLWSAGCSTGQEPLSIAMTLLDHWPEVGRADVRILATDIDRLVIAQAEEATFDGALVRAEVPAAQQRHFTPGEGADTLKAGPQVTALIRHRQLNLHDPWPFRGLFDVIFCRNVVIYFDGESRRRLWQRLASQLVPGGALFIGHSERIEASLHPLLRADGVTRYRRTGMAAASAAPPLSSGGESGGPAPTPDHARNSACL